MSVCKPTSFGHLSDGRVVVEYALSNNSGVVVKILNYGGIIRVLEIPDKFGRSADVVLGFDEVAHYERGHSYVGALVGRVAGRIGGGRLPLMGECHQLSINDPPNHLHGGISGFNHKVWDADFDLATRSLALSYLSPAGEEGYPGNLLSEVKYQLTDRNELFVRYRARTDAPTAVNLTQHSYFNLSGNPADGLADHQVKIGADAVLEIDDQLLPTGRIVDVAGSELDRRSNGPVTDFDNYWVLSNSAGDIEPRLAAELRHQKTGRIMQVLTTAPGLQVYSGTALPERLPGKSGATYGVSSGICFETQVHPDSPNQADFPRISLVPDAEYESTTVFRFLVFD